MANVLIEENTLKEIADAIRAALGTTETMFISSVPDKIIGLAGTTKPTVIPTIILCHPTGKYTYLSETYSTGSNSYGTRYYLQKAKKKVMDLPTDAKHISIESIECQYVSGLYIEAIVAEETISLYTKTYVTYTNGNIDNIEFDIPEGATEINISFKARFGSTYTSSSNANSALNNASTYSTQPSITLQNVSIF